MTETKTPELLPCPFDGGEAVLRLRVQGDWVVHCERRFAEYLCPINGRTRSARTREEAIAEWNTRAESTELAAAKAEIERLTKDTDGLIQLLKLEQGLTTIAKAEIEKLRETLRNVVQVEELIDVEYVTMIDQEIATNMFRDARAVLKEVSNGGK